MRKLIRSIESSDPKLLAAIVKAETDDNLKSYFEAMVACILQRDPLANNKANSNKNEKHSVSELALHQWLEVEIRRT